MKIVTIITAFLISVLNVNNVQARVLDTRNQSDISTFAGVLVTGECTFNINGDLIDPAPLFTPADKLSWLESNNEGIVHINNGELIDMYCEKSFKAPFNDSRKLRVQCLQGSYYLVDGLIYPFSTFICSSWPTYMARRTGRTCNGGTDLLEVGYEVEGGGFLQTMDICHDELSEVSRYTHHTMHPGNSKHQSGVTRPSFVTGGFYGGRNVNQLYTKVQQNITISSILKLDASGYFDDSKNLYIARGHMAAKADFVFAAAQRSSFLFMNVAPQWHSFNGGNWENVESSVRAYVGKENKYFDCYTGTWGVSTLPDVNGEQQQLFLDFDENGNGLIPIPKIYFRVIIESTSNEGLVIIGVNNPHASLEEVQRDYIICPDISDHLSWLTWDRHNLLKGYSYACTLREFMSVVDSLPVQLLQVTGVLGVDESYYSPKFL